MDAPNPAPLTPAHLLGMYRHQEPGYRPLVDFASWRVAILNFSQDLRVENIKGCSATTKPTKSSCCSPAVACS